METDPPKNNNNSKDKKESFPRRPSDADKSILRYTDLAIRMGVIIFLGTWLGRSLDTYFHYKKPIFSLIFSLLAVGIAMYSVIKSVSQRKT